MERGNVVSFGKESGNREGVRNVTVLYIFPPFVQYLRDIGEINKQMGFGSNVTYFPIRIGWGM